MNEDLNKIKQFENSLKAFLLVEFGTYLPEDKVSLLNATNYSDESLLKNNLSDSEIRGQLTRMMLNDLINIECTKELTVEEGMVIELPYGQNLQEALIEYYAKNLSEKYGFNINEVPGLANDLETIKLLNEKLNGTLNEQVFNTDAVKLLKASNLKELVEKEDEEAIKKYLEKNQQLASQDISKTHENEIVKEYFEREDSIQITWINEKKHVKYIDSDGKVHLCNIDGMENTNDFIKAQLASVKPGEKLDPEEFFREIKRRVGEETLTDTKDVNKEELNYEEVDMLAFINSNPKIKEASKRNSITHNNPMNTHVIEETDDIVYTENHLDHVEAKVIKNGNPEMTEELSQDEERLQSNILSEEEFKELTDKYIKGDNLTKEELEALRRSYNYYKEQGLEAPNIKEEKGAVLSPYSNKNQNYYGFADNSMITYLVVLTIFLTITLAAIILTLLK